MDYRCCGTFQKELSERFTIVLSILALLSLSLHPLTAPSYPIWRASIPPAQRLHLPPRPSPTYADRAHYSVASNSNPDHLFTDLVQHCTSTHAAEAVHSKQLRCLRLVSVSEIYVSPIHPMPWLQKWPPRVQTNTNESDDTSNNSQFCVVDTCEILKVKH